MDFKETQEAVLSLDEGERSKISDGYHDFEELYEHRCRLFVALCNVIRAGDLALGFEGGDYATELWKSKLHDDGTSYPGWFIAGITDEHGHSMSYHLPIRLYDRLNVKELEKAPKWDGHTSKDVLEFLEREFFLPA